MADVAKSEKSTNSQQFSLVVRGQCKEPLVSVDTCDLFCDCHYHYVQEWAVHPFLRLRFLYTPTVKNRNRVINRSCEITITQPLSIRGTILYEDESLCSSGTFCISIRRRLFLYPWGRVIKMVLFWNLIIFFRVNDGVEAT